jgi:citrate lyase subunit beta/citryl-CoA lyase
MQRSALPDPPRSFLVRTLPMRHFRPRRSMLYSPANQLRFLEKAATLSTDCVVMDLEETIVPEAKDQARENVVHALGHYDYGGRERIVRVNRLGSPWLEADLAAVANAGADAVLFPRIESRRDVEDALVALDRAGGDALPIMTMIETPFGVLRAEEIAGASDRIACLVMGTADLTNHLHARPHPERLPLLMSLSLVILAARAHTRSVVDGIQSNLKDMHTFEYSCRLGRDMGLDGKTLVHPDQLIYCNEAYTPKPAEIAQAKEVIVAFEQAAREGRGNVVVNGRLIEQMHVVAARRIVALDESIRAMQQPR